MAEQLPFRISSALKDIIGRDLITDDFAAIFELVKNAYDAHATKVIVAFNDLRSYNPSITIEDDGKGMNYIDILSKWLFVAYSAKKDGTEDKDYRNKIHQHKPYAGAKGIGRFSCDRLGEVLRLETIAFDSTKKKHIVETNWADFEENLKEDFTNIKVNYDSEDLINEKKSGTLLIIQKLRSKWDREKILELKKSLAKLINPSEEENNNNPFEIYIKCEDARCEDANYPDNYYNQVNGPVKNFIFETLEIKTTKILLDISSDGSNILTELKDGGTFIYKIKEDNKFNLLKDISVRVFYLNQSAKLTFAHRMGVSSKDYGSIFLYKNGIRVYPYGESGEDSLKLDSRKAQKPSIYLGNKDLIGRISIKGENSEFKETSSRGDGFIKTETYKQFLLFIEEYVIDRLEKYVIDVQKWGDGIYLSIEDDIDNKDKSVFNEKVLSLVTKLTNNAKITELEYNSDILDIIGEAQADSATNLVRNLVRLAKDTDNISLLDLASKTEKRVFELQTALVESQNLEKGFKEKIVKAEEKAEEKESENLFLRSVKSQDLDEVISFLHHIGISAGIVDNYLSGLYNKLQKRKTIDNDKLFEIVKIVLFENKKIQNISTFATKANFKLYTDAIEINLNEYLREYVNNVVSLYTNDGIAIAFIDRANTFVGNFRPIEINILVDNLLSNSKKANANNFTIETFNENDKFCITFRDDGKGIEQEKMDDIFNYGFTTNKQGSGIGLFHIKEIVERMNGKIKVESQLYIGTKFTIEI